MIDYSKGFTGIRCDRTAAIGGLALGGLSLLYGVGKDISQTNKANAIQKNLKTPVDVIPQEFYDNRNIAKQMAQVGIPQQQYNNAENNIQQNQAASLATVGRSANPGANVAAITRQGDNATNTLNAEDAAARQTNQRYFIQENAALGARKDQQEQTNVFDPYTRDFNLMQAYRGAANDTTNNLVNSGATLGNTILKYRNQYPNLFGSTGGDPVSAGVPGAYGMGGDE